MAGCQTGVLGNVKNAELSRASKEIETVENIQLYHGVNGVRCNNVEDPPRIKFDSDSKKVSVTGCIYVGPADCKRPGVTGFEEKETDVVEVTISDVKTRGKDESCDSSIASETYKLDISVEEISSLKLEAVERDVRGTVTSTSRVLGR